MFQYTADLLNKHFPLATQRPGQAAALRFLAPCLNKHGQAVLELPGGHGKTEVGYAILKAAQELGIPNLFYVVPTRALLDQIAQRFPDVVCVAGRAGYDCIFDETKVNAQKSACSTIKHLCAHAIDPKTGLTREVGAAPCPHMFANLRARQALAEGKIVACTSAFLLVNRQVNRKTWGMIEPGLIVIDEYHTLPRVARSVFKYTFGQSQLQRIVDALAPIDVDLAKNVDDFRKSFMREVMRVHHSTDGEIMPTMLSEKGFVDLITILTQLDVKRLKAITHKAIDEGRLNPITEREALRTIETIVWEVPGIIGQLTALLGSDYRPNELMYAFYSRDKDYEVTLNGHFVAALIRNVFGKNVVGLSGTVGRPEILGYETGLGLDEEKFASFPSEFPIENTALYIPTDTPDIRHKVRGERRRRANQALRLIAKYALRFCQEAGHRSLVVVQSDDERTRFVQFASEIGLEVLTYDENVTAAEAIQQFADGKAHVLLGTAAQYSEGVDLPDGIAPVIFFLRPGYAPTNSPESVFEENCPRLAKRVWAIRQHRVLTQMLQICRRNTRSSTDRGVTFFMSQHFRKVTAGIHVHYKWLRPAYRPDLTLEAAYKDALGILGRTAAAKVA